MLNQYIRIYKFQEQTLLYNTINGEIIILPNGCIVGETISNNIDVSIQEYMYNHYFLNRSLPWNEFEKRFESNNRLLISLETFLACNLSCPYCYQINNNHLKATISKDNLDLLYDYISAVHQKVHLDILILKVLGGEPSLDWSQAAYLLQKIAPFCKKNNIRLDLRIDTNCTDISKFVAIKDYDSILFTVPLCYQEVHDKYRHYRDGKGTYEKIIDNIAILETMFNCRIILRHNTDASNINYFDKYLVDISNRGFNHSSIMPQFTTNPDYGEYKNHLTYQQYVDWLSSECIDSLIKHGFKVPIYPRLLLDGKCQHWSSYSLKLFSDGKVGACAAHFFDSNNPVLSDIMHNGIDSVKEHWKSVKMNNLFNDLKCRNCPSFFGCSGHYKLPCIQELNLRLCKPEKNLYLNWPIYFKTIYKYIRQGKSIFFPGLKIKQFYEL